MARRDGILLLGAISMLWLVVSGLDVLADNSGAEAPNDARSCIADDYDLQETQCNSNNQRWFVGVPKPGVVCQGGFVPSPVQGRPCNYTCKPGQFVDIQKQSCISCQAGTYSLGDGTRWENFVADELPPNFKIQQKNVVDEITKIRKLMDEEQIELISSAQEMYRLFSNDGASMTRRSIGADHRRVSRGFDDMDAEAICNGHGWKALRGHLTMDADDCSSSIDIEVDLTKDGEFRVLYYLSRKAPFWLLVEVKSFSCSGIGGAATHLYRSLNTTSNDFRWQSIPLQEGHNVISITAIGQMVGKSSDVVLVKGIEVTGTAYATACTPCPKGMYADKDGADRCMPCAGMEYGKDVGLSQCSVCSDHEYPNAHHTSCIAMDACSDADYTQMYGACDSNGKTTLTSEWNQPKRCRDDLNSSVKLPAKQENIPCPKCNPGMSVQTNYSVGHCTFCPSGSYSDGSKACTPCGPGYEAVYGYHFFWWEERTIPKGILNFDCNQASGARCQGFGGGWTYDRNALTLHYSAMPDGGVATVQGLVAEFSTVPTTAPSVELPFFGTVEFSYEVFCPACEFTFSDNDEVSSTYSDSSWRWGGEQGHGKRVQYIRSSGFHDFKWTVSVDATGRHDAAAMIKIYSISINGTIDGGSTSCRDCSGPRNSLFLSSSSSSSSTSSSMSDEEPPEPDYYMPTCVGCPSGNYLDLSDRKNHTCVPCARGTAITGRRRIGPASCVTCGAGTTSSQAAVTCHSDCMYQDVNGTLYNFSSLSGTHTVHTPAHFTPKGTRFIYEYKLSICGAQMDAWCFGNITQRHSSRRGSYLSSYQEVHSKVCRNTKANLKKSLLHAFPLNLGSNLLAVQRIDPANPLNNSVRAALESITYNASRLSVALAVELGHPLISLFFHSGKGESRCEHGRMAVVNLMCDPSKKGNSELRLAASEKCMEGTCDGCTYSFIWNTAKACRLCTEDDYEKKTLACVNQTKTTEYWWRGSKRCAGGVSKPKNKLEACSLTDTSVGEAVKKYLPFLLAIPGIALLVVLALIVVICKNRRLSHQYQKLQQSAHAGGELPAPPSFVDDDDEDEDEVMFVRGQSQTKKLVRRLQGLTKSGSKNHQAELDGEIAMDNVPLTDTSQM